MTMLKFKFLLWMMPKLLQRAINTKPACARYVAGKNLEFQIQTLDKVGRYFRIQDGTVKSFAGLTPMPKFTLTFRNADRGFKILSAKDGKRPSWPPCTTRTWSSAATLSRCCGFRDSRTTCNPASRQSSEGSDLVKALLIRIDHGVYA
jgi:hypothetical protein